MTILRNIFIKILQWQAQVVLWKYKPRIVVVTGSIGKTSTKDAVFSVLAPFFHVRKSEKNFNNDVGVPLTILGLPTGWRNPIKWFKNVLVGFSLILFRHKYPEWLVLELGIRKPGDMNILKRWIKPDMVVISAFGTMPSHVEFFEDKYGVWEEEAGIIDVLKPEGVVLLNHDDPEVMKLTSKIKHRTYTFGTALDATLRIVSSEIDYHNDRSEAQGTIFRVDYDGNSVPVHVHGFVGNNVVYASAAALLVVHVLKLSIVSAAEGLGDGEFPAGRMRIIEGVKETMVIDDTYNSSPSALNNALDILWSIRAEGRKIAVLGDMFDLGKHSAEEHAKAGEYAVSRCDVLIAVGIRARGLAQSAHDRGLSEKSIYTFDDSREAGKFVETIIKPGDSILVKGSQGMRMERAVLEIMAHPELREKLLVRQDPHWVEKE